MNDDELRAFLDSATVGGEEDQDQEPEGSGAEPVAPTETPSAAPLPQRRGVPSFDELMSMGEPASDSSLPEATAPSAGPEPAHKTPTENAAASPVQQAKSDEQPWSQAFATDNEQLVPLILPGFSPEPRERRDLPPVFQAEPARQAPQSDNLASQQYDEPSPTQPFDVLSATETGQVEPPVATASESAAPASAAAAAPASAAPASAGTAPAAPAASAATTPVAAAVSPAAATHPAEPADDTDPFALLAPELAAGAAFTPEPEQEAEQEYERISVTGSENRGRKALPWLIVGGGVVVAIIASIFVVNGVRGTATPESTEKPQVTTQPTTEAPAETETPEPSPEPAPEPDTVPAFDPGSTWTLPVNQWGVGVPVSEKLGGRTPYSLSDEDAKMTFDSLPIAAGFSDACAAAREPNVWGLLKTADGKFEVVRPEPRCTSQTDAAIYDTIWGALDYMAKNAKAA